MLKTWLLTKTKKHWRGTAILLNGKPSPMFIYIIKALAMLETL